MAWFILSHCKHSNWSSENQLSAFPLYLSGVTHAWFHSLSETTKTDPGQLKTAFQERFAYGLQQWILSQQLRARKQAKGERIEDYTADIKRLCKRLSCQTRIKSAISPRDFNHTFKAMLPGSPQKLSGSRVIAPREEIGRHNSAHYRNGK